MIMIYYVHSFVHEGFAKNPRDASSCFHICQYDPCMPHSVAIFSSKKRPAPATHKTDSKIVRFMKPAFAQHFTNKSWLQNAWEMTYIWHIWKTCFHHLPSTWFLSFSNIKIYQNLTFRTYLTRHTLIKHALTWLLLCGTSPSLGERCESVGPRDLGANCCAKLEMLEFKSVQAQLQRCSPQLQPIVWQLHTSSVHVRSTLRG